MVRLQEIASGSIYKDASKNRAKLSVVCFFWGFFFVFVFFGGDIF